MPGWRVTAKRGHVRKPPKARPSLLDLLAHDLAEFGPTSSRNRQAVPHWTAAELAVLDRFAVAVRDRRYADAVPAVRPCRAALARLSGAKRAGTVRTRAAVHRQLILRARKLGRQRIHARWLDEERAFLDRFARAAADGRYETAREAGRACAEALQKLHRRCPRRYAGVPDRSASTIQHEIWPRLAKLRFRWFNSHWARREKAIVDRFARSLVAHHYPCLRAAARECCETVNQMHSRLERGRRKPRVVRTLPGVSDQLLRSVRRLAPLQLPHRRWTDAEWRVADRWARRHEQHMRGRLKMNLETMATMMRAELGRMGYYRNVQACVTAIVTRRGIMFVRPRPRAGAQAGS
jgi:hypothetical protein